MSRADLGMLSRILEGRIEMRYQDPKIEEHGKHWRIRPFVTTVQADGTVKRKRTPIILGYVDVMTLSEANRDDEHGWACGFADHAAVHRH